MATGRAATPAEVGDEALGRGEPDVVGDDRVDGVLDRTAVLLQVLGRDGAGPGHPAVAVDGDLEHAAQRTAGGPGTHAARDRADPPRDGAADLVCTGHAAPASRRAQRTWRGVRAAGVGTRAHPDRRGGAGGARLGG